MGSLRLDIQKGKVNTVVITRIGTDGKIVDQVHENVQIEEDLKIISKSYFLDIFEAVFLLSPQAKCLGDIFSNYDGEIYYATDAAFLQMSLKELQKHPIPSRPVVIVTAYHSQNFAKMS